MVIVTSIPRQMMKASTHEMEKLATTPHMYAKLEMTCPSLIVNYLKQLNVLMRDSVIKS